MALVDDRAGIQTDEVGYMAVVRLAYRGVMSLLTELLDLAVVTDKHGIKIWKHRLKLIDEGIAYFKHPCRVYNTSEALVDHLLIKGATYGVIVAAVVLDLGRGGVLDEICTVPLDKHLLVESCHRAERGVAEIS